MVTVATAEGLQQHAAPLQRTCGMLRLWFPHFLTDFPQLLGQFITIPQEGSTWADVLLFFIKLQFHVPVFCIFDFKTVFKIQLE